MKVYLFLILFVTNLIQSAYTQTEHKRDSIFSIIQKETSDTAKIEHYLNLTSLFLGKDPDQAQRYGLKAIDLSKSIGYDKKECTAYSYLANIKYIRSEIDSANYFLDKAYESALLAKDSLRAFNCLHNKAVILHSVSELDKALIQTDENLANFKKLKDSIQIGNCYVLLGNIFKDKGFNNIALRNFYQALKIHEAAGNKYLIAEDCLNIGSITTAEHQINDALDFLEKAVKLYDEIGRDHNKAQALNFLGSTYLDNDQYQLGKEKIEESLALSIKLKNPANQARAKRSLARIKIREGSLLDAEKYLKESLAYSVEVSDHLDQIETLFSIANVYSKLDSKAKAEEYLLQGINLAEEKAYPINLNAYEQLATILKKRGDYRGATNYLEKKNELQDSLFLVTQSRQIEELNLIYQTEKKKTELDLKESQIELLTQQVEIQKLNKIVYAVTALLSLFGAAFLFFGYRQKIKNQKIEQTIKEEMFSQEIKFKERELASQTLHLVQKNKFIQKLSDRFERIQDSEEDLKRESAKILTSLKLEPELDKDWTAFRNYFLQVHPDFDKKILIRSPTLNENELRLIYLIKMKLNSTEMATMLHVLPESIRKSKYRLKKKLSLAKEDDLLDFLLKL